MSEKLDAINQSVVHEYTGPWELVNDNVKPYSWLVRRAKVPMKRFTREDEARQYFQDMSSGQLGGTDE